MAISLGTANWRLRSQAPDSRLAVPLPRRAPVWPTVSLVFLLCLPTLFPPIFSTVLNAALVGVATLVALYRGVAVDRRVLVITSLVAVTSMLGLISGLDADRYEYFKDLWYISNPLLIMLTGYVLYCMNPNIAIVLRAFVIGGVLIALWHLRPYMMDPSIIKLPAGSIRQLIGPGSSIPVLAFMILLIFAKCWWAGLRIGKVVGSVLAIILLTAIVGMFSRTAVALLMVAAAAAVGCFVKREWLRLVLPVIVLAVTAQVTASIIDTESERAVQTFGGKLLRSLTELTGAEAVDERRIHLNWRAYETARVVDQFKDSSLGEMLIGQGFGATVDLGVTMPLLVTETGYRGVRHIGLFHNGYMFLLTKVGILGLLLYCSILVYLYRIPRKRSDGPLSSPDVAAARVMQAAVVSLMVTTYIVGGVFNRDGMFSYLLLIGCLLAHFSSNGDRSVDRLRGAEQRP